MAGGIVRIFQLQGIVDVDPDGEKASGRWNCLYLEATYTLDTPRVISDATPVEDGKWKDLSVSKSL